MKKSNVNAHMLTRRSFLKTIIASGISQTIINSSPLIAGLLFNRHAEAAGIDSPNKTVAIFVPGGAIHDFWAPTGSGSAMLMPAMSSSYDAVKTECNFLLNMSHDNAGHGRMPRVLSNSWSGSNVDTYDVYMGKQLGATLPFSFINLGVHSNGNGYLTRDGNTSIPFEDNPFTAFNLLFGNVASSNSKTSILVAHTQALNAIKNQLASYEIERLNNHLDAISDTQRRLDDLSGGSSCSTAPDATEFELSFDTFSQQARLQADIAVSALACNMTRSVSLAFGNSQAEFRIPELNYQGIYHQSIHGGSNGQANYPYYTEMRNHLGGLTAYLINKLSEAGILDSTVVIETTDMGHADIHGSTDVPLMLAGGGSAIQRGVTTPTGNTYNQLDALYTAALACEVVLPYGKEIPGILT